jgi:predicted nucleotidyltransferase
MLARALDDILGSRAKLSVLRVLFSQDGLSGREVARRAGLSPRAASLALAQLVGVGILQRQSLGGTHRFTISRQRHLVGAALSGLFQEEKSLADTMGRRIMQSIGRHKCVSVAIFGSYARGDAGPRSDLDVLVLLADRRRVPEVKEALQSGAAEFYDLFGLHLAPYVIGAAGFAGRLKAGDRLMRSLVREARVVSGQPLAEVLLDEPEEKKHPAGR